MSGGFLPGEAIVYQSTIKGKVLFTKADGDVVVEFGSGTSSKVVSPLTLTRGEIETVDYS